MRKLVKESDNDIIKKYILEEFGNKPIGTHYSYCLFPEEECSCKKLEEIDDDTSLITGGYIDSFSMVVVLVFLETTFNIKISNIDTSPLNFDTISNMVNLVKKYKK